MSENHIEFSALEGKEVLSQDGRDCGSVQDLVLDHTTWRITTIVVRLERDLLQEFGMKKPLFGSQTIHLKTDLVSGIGDKLILHAPLAELVELYRHQAGAEESADEESQ